MGNTISIYNLLLLLPLLLRPRLATLVCAYLLCQMPEAAWKADLQLRYVDGKRLVAHSTLHNALLCV
jgi:hypothetical protein